MNPNKAKGTALERQTADYWQEHWSEWIDRRTPTGGKDKGDLVNVRVGAARLVIDTGLHSMGWTREQAQEYLQAHAPTQAQAEVDRYISWPAQALSYKLGQLKIVELRKTGETQLGTKFDVRDFHDAVLRNGSLPLELLEEEVGKYVASGQ